MTSVCSVPDFKYHESSKLRWNWKKLELAPSVSFDMIYFYLRHKCALAIYKNKVDHNMQRICWERRVDGVIHLFLFCFPKFSMTKKEASVQYFLSVS